MFNTLKDFYPTPQPLIKEMLGKLNFNRIRTVLEPSAGNGTLVEAISYKIDSKDIDCIEINEDLRHILKGKKYRIVHDDFLTYQSMKRYDAIIANFPFSEGDKHVLKALETLQYGGQLVCLINSETLKNPFSNTRKDLLRKLEELNASITYIPDAFMDSERKTPVEVALISLVIEKAQPESIILNELKKEEVYRVDNPDSYQVIQGDFIKGIVAQYTFEINAGLKLIAEFNALKPLMLTSFEDNATKTLLNLSVENEEYPSSLENSYIEQVRMKYWKTLFASKEFMELFTTNLKNKYYNQIQELKDYDFSLYNIYTIRLQLSKEMTLGVEATILNLFEEFSHKYHWHDETSKNIHYYDGWKTNKAWKINKKVIIRLNAWDWGDFRPTHWNIFEKIGDIEKVFNHLSNGVEERLDLQNVLKSAEGKRTTKKIKTTYFDLTFYKKGTCHIEFTNPDLLMKFNLFGSQRKGWIPPSYGKKHYQEMTREEKTVIDNFQGQESYDHVMAHKEYYLVDTSKLLMLA